MTPDIFFKRIVEPTLTWMDASPSVAIPIRDSARVLLMAIAGQESFWKERRQVPVAYARSYWQFERGGGVAGLFGHVATRLKLGTVCAACDVPYDPDTVFEAMAWHDMLACAMARLLLYSDAAALPPVGDKEAAWQYYLRNWRPGAPHRHTWDARYDASIAAIGLKT